MPRPRVHLGDGAERLTDGSQRGSLSNFRTYMWMG
jgi:hypothetical protein